MLIKTLNTSLLAHLSWWAAIVTSTSDKSLTYPLNPQKQFLVSLMLGFVSTRHSIIWTLESLLWASSYSVPIQELPPGPLDSSEDWSARPIFLRPILFIESLYFLGIEKLFLPCASCPYHRPLCTALGLKDLPFLFLLQNLLFLFDNSVFLLLTCNS